MGAHIWAPEIHFIDGKWYVYFAAGSTSDVWAIRMYVLEGTGANPLTARGPSAAGSCTPWDTFSLDATTFVANGTRYLSWAQSEPGIANSNLFIARHVQPVDDHRRGHADLAPTLEWETPRLRGQRGSGGDPAQRPGLPDVLGQRHRRELLPGAADRVRVGQPAQRLVLGQDPRSRSS